MPLRLLKKIIIVTYIMTIFMLFFGMSNFKLAEHVNDTIVTCPYLEGHTAVCDMSPMEHMQAFQSIFTILPAKDAVSLFSILLLLLALAVLKSLRKFSIYNNLQIKTFLNYLHLKHTLIFNPLKEAFSRGILNPKTF